MKPISYNSSMSFMEEHYALTTTWVEKGSKEVVPKIIPQNSGLNWNQPITEVKSSS